MKIIDVTTTSVGRAIIKITYESFFKHVKFSGKYNFHITIDPAYGVTSEEIREVTDYLKSIEQYPCVNSVEITSLEKPTGLEGSLLILFAQCTCKYGINLEDDWRFFGDLDLDIMLGDLEKYDSCMIVFGSTHVAGRGTFEDEKLFQRLKSVEKNYIKLIPPNWACDYIPLAPNLHNNHIWIPTYIKGLVADPNRERCPDERTKEYVRSHGLRDELKVLWTEEIVVEDIGRVWLAQHNRSKQILPKEDLPDNRGGLPGSSMFRHKGYARSENMFDRAVQSIPGQTQTFMKRGADWYGRAPLYADKGWQAYFQDVDGNVYIDYVAGLGVLQMGYCHPALKEAVDAHLSKGTYFSLPIWHEIEASELLQKTVPNAEMVRFLKSGGDACSAAVTLARTLTKRQDILSCGYHGWHEQFQPFQPGAYKALKDGCVFFDVEKDDVAELLQRDPERYACVILALPYKNPVSEETVHRIREACSQYKVLFVLDDIVTGFRLALGGAQEYYHFDADIILLSKALTAGAELSAVCGKKKYMEFFNELYVSTTMGGETTALQCMINAVNVYRSTDLIAKTFLLGKQLKDEINFYAQKHWGTKIIYGYDCMPYLDCGDKNRENDLLTYLYQNGIYMRPGCNFVTGAHKEEDICYTIYVFRDYMENCYEEKGDCLRR